MSKSNAGAYRAVRVMVWHDAKFLALSDEAKLVWFHAYTNPMTNGLGLYCTTPEALAANIRWDLERYRKRFGECLGERLFEYDETYQTLWFPKYLKHNPPANPNVMKSLLSGMTYIPDSPHKYKLLQYVASLDRAYRPMAQTYMGTLPKTYAHTLPQTYAQTETVTVTGTDTSKKTFPESELEAQRWEGAA